MLVDNLKQQLTMGTSYMIVCTGKCVWLMFLFNVDKFYNFYISNFYKRCTPVNSG